MKNFALQVENVEKYFPPAVSGWRALLHPVSRLTVPDLLGISFDLQHSEVLASIGANGTGKSTHLSHVTMRELWPPLVGLLAFAAVLLPVSFVVFSWALRRTRITGTLTHF